MTDGCVRRVKISPSIARCRNVVYYNVMLIWREHLWSVAASVYSKSTVNYSYRGSLVFIENFIVKI